MTVIVRHCQQCGHDWPQRLARKPLACPHCKRYDWDVPANGRKAKARKEKA